MSCLTFCIPFTDVTYPSFDLWEEVNSSSFFTTAVQHRALREGAALAQKLGQTGVVSGYNDQAANLLCFQQVRSCRTPRRLSLTNRPLRHTKTLQVVTSPPTLAVVAPGLIPTLSLRPSTFLTRPRDVMPQRSNPVPMSLCPT